MILTQFNILKAYDMAGYTLAEFKTNSSRQWDHTDNPDIPILFVTTKAPAMELITDDGSVATIYTVDANTDVDVESFAMTVETETSYYRIIYLGGVLDPAHVDGNYYYRIEQGSDTYITDVFARTTSASNINKLLKIVVESSDVERGKKTRYTLNLTDFVFEGYFNVSEYKGVAPEKEEHAEEDDGVIDPYYTSGSVARKWIIDGNQYIWEFLLGVRILQMNGSVELTYKGVVYDASDFMAEIAESHGGANLIDIEISIKPDNEVMRVVNTIN